MHGVEAPRAHRRAHLRRARRPLGRPPSVAPALGL